MWITKRSPDSGCQTWFLHQMHRTLLFHFWTLVSLLHFFTLLGPSPSHALTPNDTYYFEIRENSKAGVFVGKIPIKPGFTYRFNEDPPEFILDAQTGVILTSKTPTDRETKDFYNLVVLSSSPTYPLEIKIKILDENDNQPYWPAYINRNITFSESAPIGTKLIIETAVDLDEGNLKYEIVPDKSNNIKSSDYPSYLDNLGTYNFNLTSDTSPFRLSYNISNFFLHLEVCDKLDRETKSSYTVNISATDEGGLQAFLVLNVVILDVNDNSPIFDHSDYSVSLNESIEKGASVLQVRATDADEEGNENSQISYYLLNELNFVIDPQTGVIFTAREGPIDCGSASSSGGNPDYRNVCVFTVYAHDHGSPQQNGRAYVTINLVDANDHDPQIKFRYFSRSDHASVDENTANGSVVAAVSVVDLDHGPNGETTLAIIDGNQLGHFRLESISNSHIIRVNGTLNQEKHSRYNLTITAHDHGTPPRSSTANLIIHVKDVNDHDSLNSAIFVSEDAPVGYRIFDVSSLTPSQRDHTNNGGTKLNLRLINCSHCDESVFFVDTVAGRITLKNQLDREKQSKYYMDVRLSDGVYTSSRKLEIIVTDINDNPPAFNSSFYSFDVPENTERGVVVGKIQATDIDEVSLSLTYNVVSEDDRDAPVFALNPKTGEFTLTRHLDYETDPQHFILLCQASDGTYNSPPVYIYFNVINVNDNRPVFNPTTYKVEVLENVTLGTQLICVSATDPDNLDLNEGDKGWTQLRYFFQKVTPENNQLKFKSQQAFADTGISGTSFAVDETTGCVTVIELLDRETKAKYDLLIVTDDGKFKTTATVQIEVKDINDNAPVFDEKTPKLLKVLENVAADSVLYSFKATDLDEVPNNYIHYELESEWKPNGVKKPIPFTIGSIDGLLRLTGKLDRESCDTYSLIIRAKDYGLKTCEVRVTVQVLDVNDNAPQFEQSDFRVNLPENTSVETRILKFHATDLDSPDKIVYKITSGDSFGRFKIVEDELILVSPLDYEQTKVIDLKIEATDKGGNFDTAIVHIEVTNVHDEAPKFLNSPFFLNWQENEIGVVGQFEAVAEVIASQYDNRITYLLKDNEYDNFNINSTNAILKVVKPIDREVLGENCIIELRVIAIDKRLPRLTGEGIIYINITDVNDNRPRFSRRNYRFVLQENQIYYAKEPFGKLTASDADSTDVINFEIVELEAKSLFNVERKTGEISLLRDIIFDREQKAFYEFNVLARDGSHEDSAKVDVIINDVNDCKPVFTNVNSARISFPQQSKVELDIPSKLVESLSEELFVFGLTVTDCDQEDSPNSKVEFSLEDERDNGFFSIGKYTGVVKMVSFPTGQNVFKLNVLIQDSAPADRLRSRLTVEIKISKDDRYKQVQLADSVTSISVSELEKVNKVIHHFQVLSRSGNVKIEILGGDPYEQFKIDRHFLRINKPLDFEKTKFYEIFVKVSHVSGDEVQFELMKMRIEVINENDNVPTFDYEVYNATIIEEVEEPIMVTQLFASDVDEENDRNGGKLRYKIIEPLNAPFRIDEKHGTIWTTSKVDREINAEYNLVVAVEDENGLSSTCKVCVTVEDKNDNPPRFTRLFSVNITENSPVGTFVIQVTSSDRDIGPYSQATYSFVEPSNVFEIESKTGDVFIIGNIDRELEEEYLLIVSANDGSWKAQTTLTVNIVDINDNAPRFERSLYEFRRVVTSDTALIGVVRAVDADKDANAMISYSLRQRHNFFTIDSQSGDISLRRQSATSHRLDTDFYGQHNITVVATDKGISPLSSYTTVLITLIPNEHTSGSGKQRTVEIPIPINLKNDTELYQLNESAILRFEDRKNILAVNGNSVVYKGEGLINPHQNYVFKLKSVSEELDLVLKVTLANDHSPSFVATQPQIVVPENEDINGVLLQLKASDPDVDKINSDIRYNLEVVEWKWNERASEYLTKVIKKDSQGPSSLAANKLSLVNRINQSEVKDILYPFRVDPLTGVVYLNQRLDYELIVEYRLEGIASDTARFNSRNASHSINVHVTDVNDNAPLFTGQSSKSRIMEVFENNPIGHVIGKMNAIDFDSMRYSQITYELAPTYDYQIFTISQKTGQIQVLISFDYEQQRQYKIEVIARNDKNVFSSILVTVKVKNVNEFKPKFTKKKFEYNLIDGSSVGTLVGSLEGSAQDEDYNDTICYYLMRNKNLGIKLDKNGIISLRDPTNLESESKKGHHSFKFWVVAKNLGPIRSKADYDEAEFVINMVKPNGSPLLNQSSFVCKFGESQDGCKDSYSGTNPGAMSVGVILVILFFVILILVISTSFFIYHNQKSKQVRSYNSNPRKIAVKQHPTHALPTASPSSTLLHPPLHNTSSNHSQPTAPPPPPPLHKQRPPDVIESPPAPPVPPVAQRAPPPSFIAASSDNYSDILAAAEHYDLENASSIAPSDIDIVYRYKGFRARDMNVPLHHRHAPLARLSPSVSELTAPRILTLQDLSPASGVPPCPPPNMALPPPPPPSNKHQTIVPSSKGGLDSIDDDDDDEDDDANTDDSFTCSEFDNNYDMNKKEKSMIF